MVQNDLINVEENLVDFEIVVMNVMIIIVIIIENEVDYENFYELYYFDI